MEENVALDTSKQKKFVKSITGIKKLLKKKQLASTEHQSEPVIVKPKSKKEKRRKPLRGLVYLSHIPHGFYESEMTEYFKQFGAVSNVRVIRSKRTGRSKGHAFVEFKQPVVAEIVAETMNNYLMGKRLIKAAYIPPEKIRIRAKRKFWTTTHNPSAEQRKRQKRVCNALKTDEDSLKQAKKLLANLKKTKQKLTELGINYDFFSPVDIPDSLIEIKIEKEAEAVEGDTVVKTNSKKKAKEPIVKKEVVKEEPKIEATGQKKKKRNKKNKKANSEEKMTTEDDSQGADIKKENVKPLEEFIKLPNESDNDDSSVDFNSDEFEKMLENDSDSDSLSENMEELGSSDDEENVTDFPPKKVKGTSTIKAVKPVQIHNTKARNEKQKKNTSPQIKRKASSAVATTAVTSKKPKFEKQGKQISTKKQFKKKK